MWPNVHLRIVLRHIRLHERIVGDGEGQPVQALELELFERVGTEYNWVDYVRILLLDRLDVLIELLLLLLFKFFEHLRALAQFDEFAGEGSRLPDEKLMFV